jgi:hypothetical protein
MRWMVGGPGSDLKADSSELAVEAVEAVGWWHRMRGGMC